VTERVKGTVGSNIVRLPTGFKNRLDLSRCATPRPLRKTPVHNWFVFPHSYSHDLVDSLIDDWGLDAKSRIYDPFVGAGTTLLSAKARAIEAIGADISPLAIFVANAKAASYSGEKIRTAWERLQRRIERAPVPKTLRRTGLMDRAFDPDTHKQLERVRRAVAKEPDIRTRQLFLLALLRVLPHFSRMFPDGGWFRWRRVRASADMVIPRFSGKVETMLLEASSDGTEASGKKLWTAYLHDARKHLMGHGQFDALITSPPYPNRHDYTRIFTTELLFLFLKDEEELKQLRYLNLRSHVEARPSAVNPNGWTPPKSATRVLGRIAEVPDKRVPRMIRGYFEDMFMTLGSCRKVVRRGGHMAFVVGNVQHAGVHVRVDEILADLGEQAGLKWRGTWLIRLRGNSAQQMGRYGRIPSRESVVIFERI
jgi:hypothetical protein